MSKLDNINVLISYTCPACIDEPATHPFRDGYFIMHRCGQCNGSKRVQSEIDLNTLKQLLDGYV